MPGEAMSGCYNLLLLCAGAEAARALGAGTLPDVLASLVQPAVPLCISQSMAPTICAWAAARAMVLLRRPSLLQHHSMRPRHGDCTPPQLLDRYVGVDLEHTRARTHTHTVCYQQATAYEHRKGMYWLRVSLQALSDADLYIQTCQRMSTRHGILSRVSAWQAAASEEQSMHRCLPRYPDKKSGGCCHSLHGACPAGHFPLS